MARQQQQFAPYLPLSQNTNPVNRYDDPNTANLPEAYKDLAANAYQNASAQYNNSFQARHPIASTALEAIGGLLLGGPSAAISLPLAFRTGEQRRKANVISGYKSYIDALNEQQQKLLPTQESMAKGKIGKNILLNHNIEAPYEDGTPLNDDTFKTILNAGTAQDAINDGTARVQNAQRNAWTAYGGFGNQIHNQLNQTLPKLQMPIDDDNPLTGNVNNTPLRPFLYTDPTIANSIVNQVGAVTNQAPNDYATLQKLSPEIAKLYAEQQNQKTQANENIARTGLIKTQTNTERLRPSLIKAETKYKNEQYRGGPAPQQPTVAALMNRNYHMGAYGKPGTPEAIAAFQSALSNDPSGYETVTQNTYDPSGKKIISSSSRRVPIRSGSSQSSQPASVPTGQAKGQFGTYKF